MLHRVPRMMWLITLMIFAFTSLTHAQNRKRDKCEIHLKDFATASDDYQRYQKNLGVQSGEIVASVGAGKGRIELLVSMFVKNVHWTLQDIDTTCLAKPQLAKAIAFHERLSGKKIGSDFTVVLGASDKTNLLQSTYDRVIMVDVYHELSSRELIITDIRNILRSGGRLVILERMGKKKGEMHGCNFPKVLESDLIADMKTYGFELERKVIPNEKQDITYYTFK